MTDTKIRKLTMLRDRINLVLEAAEKLQKAGLTHERRKMIDGVKLTDLYFRPRLSKFFPRIL